MLDLILRGGLVIDGTGAPGRVADVGVAGDDIAAVGDLGAAEARRRLDCRGLVVCPGFVDAHTHSDFTRLLAPRAESLVFQGVTTEIIGNCGFSPAPWYGGAPELQGAVLAGHGLDARWKDLPGYFATVEERGSSINCATLVGHGTVRAAVMGLAARPATADELSAMEREVASALEVGAVGFSSGLCYSPGSSAAAEEVEALAHVAAAHGGIYTTHIRSEDVGLIESVEEALATARAAGAPLQLSHHPPKFPSTGRSGETLAMIEAARRQGLDVACDLHPYTAGATWLVQLLPPSALEGGVTTLPRRLRDPSMRARIKRELGEATSMVAPVQLIRAGRWGDLRLEHSTATPELIGRSFAALADERGADPFEVFLDVVVEQGDAVSEALVIAWVYDEADVVTVMRHASSMIGSDGFALGSGPLASWRFHPRSYGTFPRVLGRYVRGQGVLTLPEAIRKMTSVPVERFKLGRRGRVTPGFAADLVAFDPATIEDLATYDEPNRLARGVHHVVVNGTLVLDSGEHRGARPGRILRRA